MLRTITSTLVALAGLTAAGAQTVAVTGGRVVTNTDAGIIDGGTVVFSNGRITAVGANVGWHGTSRPSPYTPITELEAPDF